MWCKDFLADIVVQSTEAISKARVHNATHLEHSPVAADTHGSYGGRGRATACTSVGRRRPGRTPQDENNHLAVRLVVNSVVAQDNSPQLAGNGACYRGAS